MSKSRLTLIVVASLAFLPAVAGAEGTTCVNPTVIVPDGRITTSIISAGATYAYLVASRVGSSYSVEFHNTLGAAVRTPGVLNVYSASACSAPIGVTNTAAFDPADLNGDRVSFTATTAQTFFVLNNNSGVALNYSFSVSDTTMFSAGWSTNGTYDTFYSFLNTTGSALSGTLTLYNVAGTQVSANTFTINPGGTASTNTTLLAGTPRNTTGTAKFTHNGPPGAILAEADIANFTLTPTPYVQVVRFLPMRESTH